MANSLSLDGVDLSVYGLIVNVSNLPVSQTTVITILQDKGFAGRSSLIPKTISLETSITGSALTNLLSNLDSIEKILNNREVVKLMLDVLNDRYWEVRFQSLEGKIISPTVWQGSLEFIAPNPLAYDTNLTENSYAVNADPKTIIEAVGGTADTEPIYTLTAGEDLTDVAIKIENGGKALTWTGSLLNGQKLEVDVEHWVVKKEGTADMVISGEFPHLVPGDNNIQVTNFGILGTLKIAYRNRFI